MQALLQAQERARPAGMHGGASRGGDCDWNDESDSQYCDLLSAATIFERCRTDIASPSTWATRTRATQQSSVPDVDVESLTRGLCTVGPPVHVFVSWMLACDDPDLERDRQEALNSPGGRRQMLCWLPDGMAAYEQERANGGLSSWVNMLGKSSYTAFKDNLESLSWPSSMITIFNGVCRRLLQGASQEDFPTTLWVEGAPREALQRWTLIRLHVSAESSHACRTHFGPLAPRHLRSAVAVVIQGVWIDELQTPSILNSVELVRQRERLCFRYVDHSVALFSFNGDCIYQNPASLKKNGDIRSYCADNTLRTAVFAKDSELEQKMRSDTIERGKTHVCEVKNDNQRWYLVTCTAARDPMDGQPCLCVVEADITMQKMIAAEKARADAAAEHARADAERSMNNFLAHEVRNPLSVAISGLHFISNALGENVSPAVKGDLAMVAASLSYVDALMTNVLDFNKFAVGKIVLQPERCSLLEDVLRPVVAILGRHSEGGPVLYVATDEMLWVDVDPLRLKQVMVNLVKNAIKFVSSGFVRIGARRNGTEAVEMWCEDSGPGIPEGKRMALFNQYAQLNSHDQGTGIGLALCRLITEQMGGNIGIDPEYRNEGPPGPGVRFLLTLPLPEVDAPSDAISNVPAHSSAEPHVCLRGPYRALIVDDDPALRFIGTRTLSEAGLQLVDEAVHGEDAMQKVATCTYDLIIMDQYMATSGGCMTGTEAIAALRANDSMALIVGLSANDMEREMLDAGADIFIRKPLPLPPEMAKILRERLPIPRTWRVLLADDSDIVRLVLARHLHETFCACEIDQACNGREALDMLANRGPYDLVVLDTNLGDTFSGIFVGRAARVASASAVIVNCSGENPIATGLSQEQRDEGFDLSWHKSVSASTMRLQILQCLRKGARDTLKSTDAQAANHSVMQPDIPPTALPAKLPATSLSVTLAARSGGVTRTRVMLSALLQWVWEILLLLCRLPSTWAQGTLDSGTDSERLRFEPSDSSLPDHLVDGMHSTMPRAAPILLDHTTLSGLRPDDVRRMYSLSFDEASPASLVGMLRQMETDFRAGKSTFQLAHSLKGTAASTGAHEIARQSRKFMEAPSAEGLTALWQALKATHSELQAMGILSASTSTFRRSS